jgi:hypothetical protein
MYFNKPAKINTKKTLKLAYERGKELGLDEVVPASNLFDMRIREIICKPRSF